MPIPTKFQIERGMYPRTDKNTDFEKMVLKFFGYPEDYLPDLEEARNMFEEYTERERRKKKPRMSDIERAVDNILGGNQSNQYPSTTGQSKGTTILREGKATT